MSQFLKSYTERTIGMKRRKSSGAYRKEKIIVVASSVLVLTAMTVTGVYLYNNNQPAEPENNVVDFSALENNTAEQNEPVAQAENSSAQNLTSGQTDSGELDYDPYYAEQDRILNGQGMDSAEEGQAQAAEDADSAALDGAADEEELSIGYAEIGKSDAGQGSEGLAEKSLTEGSGEQEESAESGPEAQDDGNSEERAEGENGEEPALEAVADVMREEANLHFSEETKLEWPIVGNVLLNYSMDRTIYFQTLQQYKYNPSIVIGATQGTSVACAADGVVKSIYQDPQTGMTVVMNLGDGYELTYGQLQEIMVEEGDFVETGVFLGKVAAPTKYYTVEGTNVYFKMTKDGEPVNPLNYLG